MKTIVDGKEYEEALSFEELSAWHASRKNACAEEACAGILKRAEALVAATDPTAVVVKDEGTGELSIITEEKKPETKKGK